MKMKFECENEEGTKIIHETHYDYLPDILEAFEAFLRGCGYHPKGNLEIVEEEE